MGYFDDEANVIAYEQLAQGYDGRTLIERLRRYVPAGANVLELGMGPGKDLELLDAHFRTTGSDLSDVFVSRYLRRYPGADVRVLDAATLLIEDRFDAIYSNKVLHHLRAHALEASFQRQAEIVVPGGVLLHSFWYGEEAEIHEGLLFQHWTPETLAEVLPSVLDLVETTMYEELEPDDSFAVVLRRRD